MKGVDLTVTMMLSSVLSRINLISACLPDDLQVNMEEAKNGIVGIIQSLECDIKFCDREVLDFLDKVTLYDELSSISNDLGICVLLSENNVVLEDALYNINFVIKKMTDYDSVFNVCYTNSRTRVLK